VAPVGVPPEPSTETCMTVHRLFACMHMPGHADLHGPAQIVLLACTHMDGHAKIVLLACTSTSTAQTGWLSTCHGAVLTESQRDKTLRKPHGKNRRERAGSCQKQAECIACTRQKTPVWVGGATEASAAPSSPETQRSLRGLRLY